MIEKFGFVVYVDALGTSEGQHDYEQRFTNFRNVISRLFPYTEWQTRGLTIRGLSDSVFFILHVGEEPPSNPRGTRGFGFQTVEDFFLKLKELQEESLEVNMPLRGGVTIGMTKIDVIGTTPVINFIGGEAIVDTVEIEQNLKMCGIAFAPRYMLEQNLQDIYNRYVTRLLNKNLIEPFDVPTSYGLIETYCISWPDDFDIQNLCRSYSDNMPRYRSDRRNRNIGIALKYYAAGLFGGTRCDLTEGDE